MSTDLVEQLAAYGEQHRAAQAPILLSEIVGDDDAPTVMAPPRGASHSTRFRPLFAFASAAAVVVLLVGGLAWLAGSGDRIGSNDDPAPATTTPPSPPTTSIAPNPEEDASSPAASPAEVVTPLIHMRSRLTNNANSEMFVVRATSESYWRLSTLALFDGVTWGVPESTLSRADGGELSIVGDGDELGQEIRIVNLDAALVPAAADPIAVTPAEGLRWSADSSTLVKFDGDLVSGDVYEIVSVLPRFEVEDLQAATATDAGDPIYLELPDDFPRRVDELAREVTADSTTPYEMALALQNWFRDPTEWSYSLEVQAGHGNVAMESFLGERVGYSELFAGTYAAMMRSLGIPTRVAVGFTPGNARGDQSYSVLGKHAHAWPEVWFDGLGWVPFEPTPGRGAPGAENYTNVVVPTVEWSRIDGITTSDTFSVQVISDGTSFIARVEGSSGPEHLRSDDGLRWVSTDDAAEDQFEDGGGPPPRVTLEGVTVADTGEALPTGGTLRSGPNRVIYVVNAAAGPLYEITDQEAVLINPTPSAPDERPRGRDGDGGTLTFGDAGAAYVTRFLASNVEGPEAPSELVISTDGHTWTRTTLPDEMVVSGRVRLAIGAEGVVATAQDFENTVTVWYGSIVEP